MAIESDEITVTMRCDLRTSFYTFAIADRKSHHQEKTHKKAKHPIKIPWYRNLFLVNEVGVTLSGIKWKFPVIFYIRIHHKHRLSHEDCKPCIEF